MGGYSIYAPEKRVRRLLEGHVPNELQVTSGVSVDHHCTFDGDVSDAKRACCEACVHFGFVVFEECACGGEGVVPENRG